ncbi:uncharacterized protein [Nicotiana sylvestris]|uniref:uncharacterized protein n=1 Tax=Nicotiana sylvestris TaxID=4096 RepID=UPI00388CD438
MSAPLRNWEGQSTARLPLLKGQYYSWWKNMMRDHIIGEDYEFWDIVTNSPLVTTKNNAEGVDVPKTRADCTAEDLKKWEKNAKAKKWLVCGLGPDKYNIIQSCTTTKEIWDTLRAAHEGTPQSLGRIILEEDKVEKILTRVLPVTWQSKITAIQESKNIATLKLDELIGNLTAYELRRKTMKMDAPKKERSLALRIAEGADLEDDEMAMITRDFKKYLMIGQGSSRDDEQEVSVIHLKDKIKFLSKEKLSELSLDFIDESEVINNEKEQLSRKCVILKAKCKNLELKASESDRTGKNKDDHTYLTLEENLGKMKDELYKRDKQIRVLKEDLGKVQVKGSSQIWYMDSGCSKHMTGSKNQLLSLEDLKGGNVSFGNGKKGEIIEVGKGKKVNNIYIVDLSTLLENELTCLSVLDNDPLLWHK